MLAAGPPRPGCHNAAVTSTEVLVVGAGPAGSAAAAWAARAGHDVLLVDAQAFPRDKTCGDGLTPRAIAQLVDLGMGPWLADRPRNRGIRMLGFGAEHELAWNGPHLPTYGSAAPRTELDDAIRRTAVAAGATFRGATRAVDVYRGADGRVASVLLRTAEGTEEVTCRQLIVADGVRSTLGRVLGRTWHRDTAYGIAARAYVRSERHDDPWISSHLELVDEGGTTLPGYGWIFPLGDGRVNLGVGSLATGARHGDVHLHTLLQHYARQQRTPFALDGEVTMLASAMLPMGGAASGVAGPNWRCIGDAAACVNPLNGEGIDYGLETGRLAAATLALPDATSAWPALLHEHYGATFSVARRLAALLTIDSFLPRFGPIGMRSQAIMGVALRVMGNLVSDEDADVVARLWRAAGRVSQRFDARPPWA